ncbi:MAG TPA: hypothetical protein VIW03_04720 [Anaeromyxobacter sp.]
MAESEAARSVHCTISPSMAAPSRFASHGMTSPAGSTRHSRAGFPAVMAR